MKLHGTNSYLVLLLMFLISGSCNVVGNSENSGFLDWQNGENIVPADDELLSSEEQAQYLKDAEKLAVRHINKQDSTQTEIPQGLVDLLYNGLVHIALSDQPEAVLVTKEYNVHARMPVNPREIIVYADTTAPWIDAWRNESTETGNTQVDALISEFDFTLVEYRELANVLPTAMATLRSDRAINVYAVGQLFEQLEDIESAGPDGVTDGSDISVLFFDDHLRYTFEYGYGDCPSGCISSHRWHFEVHKDGSVKFTGDEGDPLP